MSGKTVKSIKADRADGKILITSDGDEIEVKKTNIDVTGYIDCKAKNLDIN